jgi:hypothetical protein
MEDVKAALIDLLVVGRRVDLASIDSFRSRQEVLRSRRAVVVSLDLQCAADFAVDALLLLYDQLQCFVTDGTFVGSGREALERDARHRVGVLMAAYAQVGLSIASGAVAEGALRAAANLVPAHPDHPV